MSTLMFWNKQNNNNANNNNQNSEAKNGKRNWLHTPDALVNGHVVYLVKYLGNTPVEQAKGIEVVKEAIRRLQFAQQMKKAETGNQPKIKKVEITISVDGVAVQEPRTQKILHQFPLHNISYCADEKGVKKFFSFIAKNPPKSATSNGLTNGHINGENGEETHECFVFVSSKLASDITLTIGQAFDLAYRRYMTDNGKTTEATKAQAQNKQLERAVSVYRHRLKELSEILPKSDLERLLSRLGIRDLLEVPIENGVTENGNKTSESENDDKLLIETSNKNFVPAVPPRNLHSQINNTLDAFKPSGQKMDELLLNSDSDSDFDPRAEENDTGNKISNDLFGFEPKTYNQQNFNINNNNNNFSNNNLSNGLLNGSSIPPTSPPPLLAPPPKAAIPRRVPTTNGNMNGAEDLFGSEPFSLNTPNIFNDKTDGAKSSAESNENGFKMPPFGLNRNEENFKNPFNESGIHDMNITTLPEINTFANNFNRLDGVLKNNTEQDGHQILSENFNGMQKSSEKVEPASNTRIKDTFTIPNPFSRKTEMLLASKNSNYGPLRSSPSDFDAMQDELLIARNEKENSKNSKGKSKTASFDIFKDAATAAFTELNNFGTSLPSSSSGGSGLSKPNSILVDDFSLESLDPLRK